MATISLDDLQREFGAFAYRATDLTPVMRVGGMMGLSELKERFRSGVGPDGKAWAPLKFPRPEGGTLPLRNHGILAASYTLEYGSNFFRVGTNLQKARTLHYGATIVPTRRKALTIPLTIQAVRAGSAPAQGGLVVRGRYLVERKTNKAGVVEEIRHWLFVKSVTIPARPQVGISDELKRKFSLVLYTYLRTGRLS